MGAFKKMMKMAVQMNAGDHRINVPTYDHPIKLAEDQPIQQQAFSNEFGSVLIVPSRNSVNVVDKAGQIIMSSPMDRSAFKDIEESVALLGPNPNVETVDCRGIADAILNHFNFWYSDIQKDGPIIDDVVDLLKEMMMYAVRNHPMVMASPVAGLEVIGMVFDDVLERIEDA